MKKSVEIAISVAAIVGSLPAGAAIADRINPHPQAVSSPASEERPKLEVSEEFTLTEFFAEVDEKLKNDANVFLGRKFKITLDQNVFVIRAVEQQELKSEDDENLGNYVLQGRKNDGEVGFIILNVPDSQIGEGPYTWPPSSNPPRPRMFPKKTVLEFEGKKIQVSYQASADRYAKMAVPILIVKKTIPPKPELALANIDSPVSL